MRTTILVLTILLFGTSSCTKRTRGTMTVIKDCTGVYLRLDNKDYAIGNENKLDQYSNGTVVKASFVNDAKCISDRVHCMTIHDHETVYGPFRVTSVRL